MSLVLVIVKNNAGFEGASGVISLGRVLVVQGFVESRSLLPGALGRSKTGNGAGIGNTNH